MQAIIDNIKSLYKSWKGIDALSVDVLPQSGSERRYFRLFGKDESVIGCYGANIKENESFIYFSKQFRAKKLAVPEIFAVSDDGVYYLQEDFGDVSLLHHLESKGFTDEVYALFKQSLDELAKLQVSGDAGLDYNRTLTNREFGKEAIMAEFLQDENVPIQYAEDEAPRLEELTPGWELRHLNLPHTTQEMVLRPVLDTYQLSATHLNNFLDITRGGPQAFLLQNLLRFPQAMTPSQAFGFAIHAVLARAHTHLSATGERRPIEDILHDYELQLQSARLSERDFTFLHEKGSAVLHTFLASRYDSFLATQRAERSFGGQNIRIGDVRLTGAIDLLDINTPAKTLTVTDYKTGKCHTTWRGVTDYERIKLHKYKQQLMLYKLLAENSRDFTGYTVTKASLEFVEPDESKQCHSLELTIQPEDLAIFKQLLTKVWQHIMELNFPDTSRYDATFNGILAFERDLLEGTI